MTLNFVQLRHPQEGRRIALVEGDRLLLLQRFDSIYSLASSALLEKTGLAEMAAAHQSSHALDYEPIYLLQSEWRLLPAFDHPHEEGRCLVSGTGLTHKSSALTRQAMHVQEQGEKAQETDSLRVFRWGLEGGRPLEGHIGAQPEWFYKGRGEVLRAHGEALEVPEFADDGGEEGEIAGAYLIAPDGTPRRVGLCVGNEFSDHIMERKNYLYLAPSKLRTCAIGPELVVGAPFENVAGSAKIERAGKVIWSAELKSGEQNMAHSLANLEHHHFKYPSHRRPGDVHIHYFGADAFSFSQKVALQEGDAMEIAFEGLGRALRNPIPISRSSKVLVKVEPL